MGTQTIPVSCPITFSHPAMQNDLVIDTGVNSISWPYRLNIVSRETLGGQVLQILSCTVDRLTISGTTRSREHLAQITEWFTEFLTIAGTGKRDQRAVLMSYPTREWEIYIWPVQTPMLHEGTTVLGAPWEIVAEIASSKEMNQIATGTMAGQFADTSNFFKSNQYLWQMGFNGSLGTPNANILIDPTNPANSGMSALDNIGRNMQSAVASLIAGDAGILYGLDPASDPSKVKSAAQIYQQVFGSNYLDPSAAPSGSNGTTNPTAVVGGSIADQIYNTWESHNMPGVLGVTVAYIESTFRSDAWNGTYLGLFQTNQHGRGASAPDVKAITAAYNAAKAGNPSAVGKSYGPIAKLYPAANQIADAANWFTSYRPSGATAKTTKSETLRLWAVDAQLGHSSWPSASGNAPYNATNWPKMMKEAMKHVTLASSSNLDAAAAGQSVLNDKNITLSHSSESSDIRQGLIKAATLNGMLSIASAHAYIVTALRTDHPSNDGGPNGHGHNAGYAVDIGSVDGKIITSSDMATASAFQQYIIDNQHQIKWTQLIGPDESRCGNAGRQMTKAEANSFYTPQVLAEHKNHVHCGFG